MKPFNRFEDVPIKAIQPHDVHFCRWEGDSAEDLRLMHSLERFGVLESIIVEEDTYRIVDGHRRFGAARALGLRSLPCTVHPRMTEGEYESLRFTLQHSAKRVTNQQLRRWIREAKSDGIDVRDIERDLVMCSA